MAITEAEAALYAQLDFYIIFCCLMIGACFTVSYKLMPRAIPGEPKVSPLAFFLGTSCLKYVRRPGDPPWTVDDYPDWRNSFEEYNIDLFVAEMEKAWRPGDKRSLLFRMMWRMGYWWGYSFCMFGCERIMMYIQMSYVITTVLTMMTSETVPHFGADTMKLMFLGFVLSVGTHAVRQWCQLLLALKGTDPCFMGLSLLVVQKMHKLNSAGRLRTNSAEAQQVTQECYYLNVNFWGTPLQTFFIDVSLGALTLCRLYLQIGVLGIAVAVVTIAALFGVGTLCDMKRRDLDTSNFQATMTRQTTLNLLLDNFRELRLYGWVERASKPLEEVRKQLRSNFWWSSLYATIGGVCQGQVDSVMTVMTCVCFVFVQGRKVDFAETQMSRGFMASLMMVFGSLSMCRWSYFDMVQRCQRIQNFLELPEVDDEECLKGPLKVESGVFAHAVPPEMDEEKKELVTPEPITVLKDINLQPEQGELVLVCGAIGSGKSSLLQAILGETVMLEGKRWLPDAPVAYQPQVPFLIEGTIRDNVLFGIEDEDCNDKHLQKALTAAQLAVDIADPRNTLYAKGEKTDVGKRGTHLSGGQRARTALARSVYAVLEGAPLAILDDPVASVDNEVVQAAWDEAVLGAMKSATRVVVVNSQLLERLASSADRLVVMEEGKIVFNGPPAEAFKDQDILSRALSGKFEMGTASPKAKRWGWLPAGLTAVKDFLAFFGNPTEGDPFTEDHLGLVQKTSPVPLTFEGLAEQGWIAELAEREERKPPAPAKAEEEEEDNGGDPALELADLLRESEPLRDFLQKPLALEDGAAAGEQLPLVAKEAPLKLSSNEWEDIRLKLRQIEKKFRHPEPQGKPKMNTLQLVAHLIITCRFMFVICMLMGVLLGFKEAITLVIISRWASIAEGDSDTVYLLQLIGLFVSFAVLGGLQGILDGYGNLCISLSINERIDEALKALGMPFFWRKRQLAEPHIRKVVNTDTGMMSGIARLPMMCIECFIVICIASLQSKLLWFLMPVSLIGYYNMSFIPDWRNMQLWPTREQLQNAGWARVVEQWDVLAPLRALRRQKVFERTVIPGIMVVSYSNIMNFQLEILMSICTHTIGAIFNVVAMIILIRLRADGATPTIAFAFWSQASNFSAKINQVVGMYMPFKDLLTQYDKMQDIFCSDTLETNEGESFPKGWPSTGKIEFSNVTFRYVGYLPPALQDVNLVVQPGEKLGVVGKTGSGKSTLVSLLLRLGPLRGVPPSSGGKVMIDGVDIASLRFSDLRQKVAVVPQEPTLFTMSLKENVGEEFTDAEVLTSLQWCNLDPRKLTGLEDSQPLADALTMNLRSGSLSVGQQQLLMAARALVRRPRVLVLDECTASLDRDSADNLLEVLNSHSKDATVLAIAHRLRFVVNSDRILVLSHGRVVQCDTPAKLLENPDSYFSVNLRYEQQQDSEK